MPRRGSPPGGATVEEPWPKGVARSMNCCSRLREA